MARRPVSAKPRDAFAGLQYCATGRGYSKSRCRNLYRPVLTGFIQSNVVGSFIYRAGLLYRLHTQPASPRGDNSGAYRATTIAICAGCPTQNHPQTWCRRWSPPVRFRPTRNRGTHNSETPRQQPNQPLVREPIPTRITVAISVDAFLGCPSIGVANYFRRMGEFDHETHM